MTSQVHFLTKPASDSKNRFYFTASSLLSFSQSADEKFFQIFKFLAADVICKWSRRVISKQFRDPIIPLISRWMKTFKRRHISCRWKRLPPVILISGRWMIQTHFISDEWMNYRNFRRLDDDFKKNRKVRDRRAVPLVLSDGDRLPPTRPRTRYTGDGSKFRRRPLRQSKISPFKQTSGRSLIAAGRGKFETVLIGWEIFGCKSVD
jgi:hypothetical protein